MTAPLNRIPDGLLDFFQVKSQGQVPQRLVPALQPTMELFRWYADANAIDTKVEHPALVIDSGNATVAIPVWTPTQVGDGVATIVPQTEVWILLEAVTNWTFTGGAAATGDFGLIALFGSEGFTMTTELVGFTSGAVINRSGTRVMERPWFLPPGTELRGAVFGATVGTGQITRASRIRLLRMRR